MSYSNKPLNTVTRQRKGKMILTDYYRFEKLSGQKSKMRMDCTASTNSYDEFECRRAIRATKASIKRDATNVGDLVIYYGDRPENMEVICRGKQTKVFQ